MTVTAWALRLVAVAGLAVDAYIHLDLRATYDAVGEDVTQGQLFVVASVVAILAGLVLLGSDHRLAWLAAVGAAGSALGAVLLYRYVDVGAIGPIPNMYEPVWYDDKTYSAVAEGAVLAAAAIREALRHVHPRRAALPPP